MKSAPISHGSFVIERTYATTPAKLYAAWIEPRQKARWFVGPEGWTELRRELVVRTGGQEVLHGRFAHGVETLYTARYHDVIDPERLVYVYDMHLSGIMHSTSLASVEFVAEGTTARLIYTEQVAFLDGTEGTMARERGTAAHLERLAACVETPR